MVGNGGERDQLGSRDVAGAVLVGLAHVDHEGTLGDTLGEGGDFDLGNRHGAEANRRRSPRGD